MKGLRVVVEGEPWMMCYECASFIWPHCDSWQPVTIIETACEGRGCTTKEATA